METLAERTEKRTVIYTDRDPEGAREFLDSLRRLASVTTCHDLDAALEQMGRAPNALSLFETQTLADSSAGSRARLLEHRNTRPMALVTCDDLETYIHGVREWGLTQVAVRTPPVNPEELGRFLAMVENPLAGFGLMNYLGNTIEMYSIALRTLDEKKNAIERVINHFASCGFEVHELYEVRLILEEVCNNAFFHAFRTASGDEKYSIRGFSHLQEGEEVRIEYGSDRSLVGFTVTDNAGTLTVNTLLTKLERQLTQDAMFDESGRGLYLSRLLTSNLVVNIEQGRRTQFVALFDSSRRTSRPKPFLLNYSGADGFEDWRNDPELDA